MIVDVHTHTPSHVDEVPPSQQRSNDAWGGGHVHTTQSWADYAAGVTAADITIVFHIAVDDSWRDTGLPPTRTDGNTATASFVRSDPRRRIGFCSVNPASTNWRDELDRAQDLGLVGIKLGANYQRFDPLGAQARELYRLAEKRGLPILFHQGASPITAAPLAASHPLVTDEIAMLYPELRIVMAHLGHPFTREAVTVIRKHPHVYADVSALVMRPWTAYEGLLFAQEWGGAAQATVRVGLSDHVARCDHRSVTCRQRRASGNTHADDRSGCRRGDHPCRCPRGSRPREAVIPPRARTSLIG